MTDNVKAFMNALQDAGGEWREPDLRGTPFSIEYHDYGVDLMIEDDVAGDKRPYWTGPKTGATAVFFGALVHSFMNGVMYEIRKEKENADS